MTERCEPAAQRTPREIWWKILDEFIYGEDRFILSTTFQGKRWSDCSDWSMFRTYRVQLEHFEKRRKIIGSVCRSWYKFSCSERYVDATPRTPHGVETHEVIRKALTARRVTLVMPWCNKSKHPAPAQGFNWEIAEISDDAAPLLASLPLPRLRRLRMICFNTSSPLDLNPLLDVLSTFNSLTWLDYEAFVERGEPVPIKDRSPIVLPNLQVLWYKNRKTFRFPFSHLILPSLQYLTIQIYESSTLVPLLDLLSCYRKTLRSFVAARFKHGSEVSFINFPPWRDFPKLEELVLDEQWVVRFQPLPPNHPLQILDAHFRFLDTIVSLLEGVNLQTVILRRTRWRSKGGLKKGSGGWMDNIEADRLMKRAKDCRVEIRVTWDGSKFLDRDEVIASAAGARPG
jgi:hypothetical protein